MAEKKLGLSLDQIIAASTKDGGDRRKPREGRREDRKGVSIGGARGKISVPALQAVKKASMQKQQQQQQQGGGGGKQRLAPLSIQGGAVHKKKGGNAQATVSAALGNQRNGGLGAGYGGGGNRRKRGGGLGGGAGYGGLPLGPAYVDPSYVLVDNREAYGYAGPASFVAPDGTIYQAAPQMHVAGEADYGYGLAAPRQLGDAAALGGRAVAKQHAAIAEATKRRVLDEGLSWQHDMFQEQQRPVAPRRQLAPAPASTRILISNLDFNVSEDDILELFSTCGSVIRHKVIYDRSGRSLGNAEVTYATREEALAAKQQYNNVALDGQKMTIELADSGAAGNVQRLSSGISVTKVGGTETNSRQPGNRLLQQGLQAVLPAAARPSQGRLLPAAEPASLGGRGGRLRSSVVHSNLNQDEDMGDAY